MPRRRLLHLPRSRAQIHQEMRDEVDAHIALGIEHLVQRGIPADEAERRVRARFGDLDRALPLLEASALERSRVRERRERVRELIRDVRVGVRQLRRSPGFALGIILSLGFGIGASATVFSWMEGLVLRPFPAVRDVDRLISVRPDRRNGFGVSLPEIEDWRARSRTVTGLTAVSLALFAVRTENTIATVGRPVYGMYVAANYFDLLGVRIANGRAFSGDEDLPGAAPLAVISDGLWRQQLNAVPDVVGRIIHVNEYPVRVIGVAPPDFAGTLAGARFDLWVPLSARPLLVPGEGDRWRKRDFRWLDAIGRLEPGVTVRHARNEFVALGRWQASEFAENRGRGVVAIPLDFGTATQLEPLMLALVVITGLVILLICSNVANLLLARAASRHRELAVRLALGASRGVLVRQLMIESALLAIAGALLGCAIASQGQPLLAALTPSSTITLGAQSGLDVNFMVFVIAITGGSALAFGLMPALAGSRLDVADALKNGARGSAARNSRTRSGLVVAQFAFALSALVCAALVLKRDRLVRAMDFGLREPESVLLMQMERATSGYSEMGRWERAIDLAVSRVSDIQGVEAVTYSSFVPLGFVGYNRRPVRVPRNDVDSIVGDRALLNAVAPGYFDLMRIPIVAGRAIDRDDAPGKPAVAVINEAFAARYFAGESPLGRTILVDEDSLRVVGVARNGIYDYRMIDDPPEPAVYSAWKQAPSNFVIVHVRSGGDAAALSSAVRAAILTVDPKMALLAPVTLARYASVPFFPSRSALIVTNVLGVAALMLAAMGLFSVIAYGVAVRTREVGIRVALGASRGRVVGMFVRASLRLVVAGLIAGTLAAAAFTTVLRSRLSELPAPDVLHIAIPALVLGVSAVVAALIPSFRAASIDPVGTLRQD